MSLLTNLVSYWKLDESSGNASDSVGSNTLTNNNSATYAAGKINNGVDLEVSSNQSLSILDASQSGLDLLEDFTFSHWVKFETLPASNSRYHTIFKQDQYQFRCIDVDAGGNKTLMLYLRDATGFYNPNVAWTPSTGVLYFVCVKRVKSTGIVTFYVNGSIQGSAQSTSRTADLLNTANKFEIGADGGTGNFDGIIDEIGVWSRALSDSEITELYRSGSGNQYPFSLDVSAPLLSIVNTLYAPTLSFINPVTVSAPLFTITNTFYAPSLQIGIWSNQSKNTATWSAQTKNTVTWTNQDKT